MEQEQKPTAQDKSTIQRQLEKMGKAAKNFVVKKIIAVIVPILIKALIPIIIGILIYAVIGAVLNVLKVNNQKAISSVVSQKLSINFEQYVSIKGNRYEINQDLYKEIREGIASQRGEAVLASLYLDEKYDYLEKMLNSEIIGRLIDLGGRDLEEKEIQGIVEVKRQNYDGNKITRMDKKVEVDTLEYVPLEELESLIAGIYHHSDKQGGLSHDSALERIDKVVSKFSIDDQGNIYYATYEMTEHVGGTNVVTYIKAEKSCVNYRNLVSNYGIPFEFLSNLLEVSKNPEWIAVLTELISHGKINLMIQDSAVITDTEAYPEDEPAVHTINTKTYAQVYVSYAETLIMNMNQNYTCIPTTSDPRTSADGKVTTTTTTFSWKAGVPDRTLNTDVFLGTWKNNSADGTYIKYYKDDATVDEDALYKKRGKHILYRIPVRNELVCPALLIESSHSILFKLLGMQERTQMHEAYMKYVLYVYTGRDYGVTDPNDVLALFGKMSTYSSSGYGFWWPIGCGKHTTQCDSTCTPVPTTVTSPFGLRGDRQHNGIDIAEAPYIIASKSGTVTYATPGGGWCVEGDTSAEGRYGNYVEIEHDDGFVTRYAHMKTGTLTVSTGDRVGQGQVIGQMGNTGDSSGPHLHFEIRINGTPVDPLQGYVDPTKPYPESITGGYSDIVWAYLINKGLTTAQVAGIMGNMEAESTIIPWSIEGGKPESDYDTDGVGIGLCQWTFNPGRKGNLLNYANKKGTSWKDIYTQLEFLWGELIESASAERSQTGAVFAWSGGSSGSYYQKFINPNATVYNTSTAFLQGFEIPDGRFNISTINYRYELSVKWYSTYTGQKEWQDFDY